MEEVIVQRVIVGKVKGASSSPILIFSLCAHAHKSDSLLIKSESESHPPRLPSISILTSTRVSADQVLFAY